MSSTSTSTSTRWVPRRFSGDVITPVGNAAGQRGGAGAFLALGVGARAEHRIAIDDGGGFHPGAMLAFHRHIADLIGRAGREHVDAERAEMFLALFCWSARSSGMPWMRQFSLSMPVMSWQVFTAIFGIGTTSALSRLSSE